MSHVAVPATGAGYHIVRMTMKSLADFIAVAADPSTSVEQLVSLADAPQEEIHRALARNPNTPVDLLQHFWETHPDCILENPVLTLWEFTKPESAVEFIGGKVLLLLYNHLRRKGEPLPSDIFKPATIEDMVREAVSSHNPDVFEFLPIEKASSLRRLLIENPAQRRLFRFFENKAPDELWLRFATDADPEIRLGFANLLRSAPFDARPQRSIVAEATRLLMRDGRPEVVQHLANCRFLPGELVEKLSFSGDVEARVALARCFFAPDSALERLARDTEEAVRISLARHCEEKSTQCLLLRDSSATVRKRLAESPHLCASLIQEFDLRDDPEVLKTLFLRADDKFRARILREAPPEVQHAVLDMEKSLKPGFYRANKAAILPDILAQLGRVKGIHPDIIDDLARDGRPEIRLGVAQRMAGQQHSRPTKRNIALVNNLAKDPSSRIRHEICTDCRLDADSTAALFGDPDPVLRKKTLCAVLNFLIAEREGRRFESYANCYREKAALIVKLACDPDHAVRFAIASCKEAPPAAMEILLEDAEAFIRNAAMSHERCPYGVMLDLVETKKSHMDCTTLFHGETTPSASALRLLATSQNPFLRKLVAHCKRTPMKELRKLASDPHPAVRDAALSRL